MSNRDEVALWIKGKRGLGKTEFFHHVMRNQIEFELCYFDIKNNKNTVDIITEFIVELQKHGNKDFLSSVMDKYKQFYHTNQKLCRITSALFPKISNVVNIILDPDYYVITNTGEHKNTINLINDYISLIIKNKRLCVCIDNFSRCNIEIAQIFFSIIKQFIKNDNFKACIITTNEDLTDELNEEIHHILPFSKIQINTLKESNYFYQILDPIFNMGNFSKEDINYIYGKCNGSPKKLSTIISKLLEKNGITLYRDKKARINKQTLFSILQKEYLKFDENDFTSEQKWVIFSYLCLNEQTSINDLKELALYISKENFLYRAFDEKKFDEILLNLINSRILSYNRDGILSSVHDQDYIDLMDIFMNSNIKGIFSQHAYQFLLENENYYRREELLCQNAYIAEINNWYRINYRYGKKLFKKGFYQDANKVFSNLQKAYNKLSPLQMLLLAVTSYETGNYQNALEQFELININKLSYKKLKYNYYFYKGKTYNNVGNTLEAIKLLQTALKEVNPESKEYIKTLNVLHMYCMEVPEQLEKAKKIFRKIKESYKEKFPHEWANTMRGCHNFYNDETALSILNEADSILIDELEKAYLMTTKGFIYVKLDQLQIAENLFKEASATIKELKLHEFSYAANNLAVCYMIKKKYKEAKNILIEALFWNKTNYGNLVLNTHLMICSIYLNEKEDCEFYYDFLQKYMDENIVVDPIINRKIYINLAIASRYLDKELLMNTYFKKAEFYVTHSSSEWRYSQLTNKFHNNKITTPPAPIPTSFRL